MDNRQYAIGNWSLCGRPPRAPLWAAPRPLCRSARWGSFRKTIFYPIAYCLLPIAYCLLPIAYCLLPTAYCLFRIAYCLMPIAYCLLHVACCLEMADVPTHWTRARRGARGRGGSHPGARARARAQAFGCRMHSAAECIHLAECILAECFLAECNQ